MEITALGMIETSGLLASIEAADAGLKAANVHLLGTDYVRGGLVMVRFEGEVAAVQAAVDAGAMAAGRVGHVLSAHVIPRAMPEVFCMLASDPSVGPGKRDQGGCSSCGGCEGGRRELACIQDRRSRRDGGPGPSGGTRKGARADAPGSGPSSSDRAPVPDPEELKSWKVVALRSYVRKLPGFPMTANEIRFANKAALLKAIEDYRGSSGPAR